MFLKFKLFSVVDVREVVEGLRDRVATSDGIPTKLIEQLFSVNRQVIMDLINQTLNSGKVPKEIKNVTAKPLFKKGERTFPSNYKAITLLSNFSKKFR